MDMANVSIRDVRLGHGVVAAVLHVAAAGARGSRELAMALNAARDAVDSETGRGRYAAPFDASFSQHLTPRAFEDLRHRSMHRALESLHEGVVELLQPSEAELLKIYGDLVLVAAEAAAKVRTEEGLLGWRRIEYAESRALDQIRSIFAAPRDTWGPGLN